MEFNQPVDDEQFLLQLLELAVQRQDLAILGIKLRRRPRRGRRQARGATLSKLCAPVDQVRVVDTFSAQQRTQLAVYTGVGKVKNALLLRCAVRSAATLARYRDLNGTAWICRANPLRLWHVALRKAAPKKWDNLQSDCLMNYWRAGPYRPLLPFSYNSIRHY